MAKWANIKIKEEFYAEIAKLLESESWLGYASVTSFCNEAIRKYYFETVKQIEEKKTLRDKET